MSGLKRVLTAAAVVIPSLLGVTDAEAGYVSSPHRALISDTHGGVTADKSGFLHHSGSGDYVGYGGDITCGVWQRKVGENGKLIIAEVVPNPGDSESSCCPAEFNRIANMPDLLAGGLTSSFLVPSVAAAGITPTRVRVVSNISCHSSGSSNEPSNNNNSGSSCGSCNGGEGGTRPDTGGSTGGTDGGNSSPGAHGGNGPGAFDDTLNRFLKDFSNQSATEVAVIDAIEAVGREHINGYVKNPALVISVPTGPRFG